MAKLKLKVAKSGRVNPQTKAKGFAARVITNGATSETKHWCGPAAFYGCTSLTDVYCYAENAPSTSFDAFENSSFSSATLHVPAGSVSAYKAAEPWKNFKSIVAIE